MTAPAAPSVRHLGLGDFDHEVATTRRLLERVPDEHLAWRPHAKSSTLGELASHVATLLGLQLSTIGADHFDFTANGGYRPVVAASRADLLALFDRTVADVRAALDTVTDDAAWFQSWALRRGEQTLLALPKLAAFRTIGINHLVHHRGQLSVYLRLLDVPLPSIYGPSADEGF